MNIRKIIREEITDSEFKSIMDYHNSLVDSVYEDDNFLIAAPKTHQSPCYYGSGTQIGESTEDEFKWIKNVGDSYTGVDVSQDWWGGWKFLSKPFIELGLHDLNGRVLSSDYDGNIDITLNINNRLHLSIFIRTVYQELEINVVKVYWTIQGYIPMDSSYTKVTTLSDPAALVKELPPYGGNYNDGQLKGKEIFQPVEEVIKKYLKTYLKH